MRSTIVVAVILLNSAIPGHADWQYTRWGMSEEEVLAASNGALKRCDPKSCEGQSTKTTTARLSGTYQSNKFVFSVYASFDKKSNKLAHVNLQLRNPQKPQELIGTFQARYGEPAVKKQESVMTLFVWHEPKDQISIVIVGSGPTASAFVSYAPSGTDANRGL